MNGYLNIYRLHEQWIVAVLEILVYSCDVLSVGNTMEREREINIEVYQ